MATKPREEDNTPSAEPVPPEQGDLPRVFGALKGKITIADDFDELPPDILKEMTEGPI